MLIKIYIGFIIVYEAEYKKRNPIYKLDFFLDRMLLDIKANSSKFRVSPLL